MQLIGCELRVLDPQQREQTVAALGTDRPDSPLLVLNTCQRLECYGWREPVSAGVAVVRRWHGAAAIERLARIASGLECRVLGELEVLGQVRTAYRKFRERRGSGHADLDRLFQDVLALARRARRLSKIDQDLVSLGALAARELLARVPAAAPIAIVGTGSLASSVAHHLAEQGRTDLRVIGRRIENAVRLAHDVNGRGGGLTELPDLLAGAAGIFTATAAPGAVIHVADLEQTAPPLTIVDLGEPPDCEPAIIGSAHCRYVGLLEVESRVRANVELRQERAQLAAQIVHAGAWQRYPDSATLVAAAPSLATDAACGAPA